MKSKLWTRKTPDSGGVAAPRVVGTGFDSLIATARTTERTEHVATRVVDVWKDNRAISLEIRADQLLCDDKEVVDSREANWVLPAFMAGVRSIRLDDGARADDLLRFAEELSHLETSVASLGSFRDWIWSEGAEGIDVEMQMTFVEIFEDAEANIGDSGGEYGEMTAQALLPMDIDSTSIDLSDLDAATLRPEFLTAVSLYRDGRKYRGFEMTPDEGSQLARAAEDETGWSDAELRYVLESDTAQKGYPPVRLARRLVERFERSCDEGALNLVARLAADRREYAQSTRRELDRLGLGRRLAQGLTTSVLKESRQLLTSILDTFDDEQIRAFALQTVHRMAAGDSVGRDAFAFLVELFGSTTIRDRVGEGGLPVALVAPYLEAIRRHTPLGSWAEAVAAVPFEPVIDVLAEASVEELIAVSPLLHERLCTVQRAREVLVEPLLATGCRPLVDLLFEVVLRVGAEDFSTAQTTQIFQRATASDELRQKLVTRARQNDFDERTRLIALSCISDFESQREVSKFSVREWFAPPTVRQRVRDLRRDVRTKTNSTTVDPA